VCFKKNAKIDKKFKIASEQEIMSHILTPAWNYGASNGYFLACLA